MRKFINKLLVLNLVILALVSCTELDLTPRDAPTSAPFTSTQQFREGLNESYRETWYKLEDPRFSIDDDSNYRQDLSAIKAGTVDADYGTSATNWSHLYKAIARTLSVRTQILNQSGILTEIDAKQFLGEADFHLANYWTYMITRFGDVPYFENQLSVEEAFNAGRTSKDEILQKVYAFYDSAIEKLPTTRSGLQYATKGAAMAMKARAALYVGDFAIAAESAKDCMDLGVYDLHPDFLDLFKSVTRTSDELIFYIPRDESKGTTESAARGQLQPWRPRGVNGGWAGTGPTWSLLASYECIDGLPIDESPLFDPKNPFKNRDPRCAATIVAFGSLEDGDGRLVSDGTRHMGYEITPHPFRPVAFNYFTNTLDWPNQNTKSFTPHSNYQGLLYRKFIDEEWTDGLPDGNRILMRYADVLLIYAEAKIELNQIDASVLDAINAVRDRAYASSVHSNPTVTTTNQAELRYVVRNERRAEFAMEGLRYMDIIRWRIAEKVLNGPYYGLLTGDVLANPNDGGNAAFIESFWFWGMTPQLDEDGIADFKPLADAGYASQIAEMGFDANRQYLYPIPNKDILLAPNLTQNPGY
ncbi:RagB/SusD family nutrient uptake outer membrane protein [Aureibaculum conchae]|uniref:RagB/SusD family nutrient uptake outer membrane protein n=1 Tax=Aureibaculum sp. 2308TA14-22 TaxID=3108392 RepID=UPI00339229CF